PIERRESSRGEARLRREPRASSLSWNRWSSPTPPPPPSCIAPRECSAPSRETPGEGVDNAPPARPRAHAAARGRGARGPCCPDDSWRRRGTAACGRASAPGSPYFPETGHGVADHSEIFGTV